MSPEERQQVLNMLEAGKITASQALALIEELRAQDWEGPELEDEEGFYVS